MDNILSPTAVPYAPALLLLLFLGSSALMIWRLEAMTRSGMEGTVLGTLVMPYCSGIGNLIFVLIVVRQQLPPPEVITNSLVNNITNLTLCIGLPAIFWGTPIFPSRRKKTRLTKKVVVTRRLNRLSMLLTLTAVFFFTGAMWALGRDGALNRGDGIVLVGLFLFWQVFQVFDVLKGNIRDSRSLPWTLALDFALLLAGGYGVYYGIDGLVNWLSSIETGFVSANRLGWITGWLMVLPNAGLALYYGWQRQPEVVYTSQVGDGHICIPLCVGLIAFVEGTVLPAFFLPAIGILLGSVLLHAGVVLVFGQLPRLLGWLLTAVYGFFLYRGLVN